MVRNDPSTSTRRVAAQLPVSNWQVWRVLNRDKMHPYHTMKVQELLPVDLQRRLDFCYLMKRKLEEDNNFIKNILWTDECTFTKAGYFNTHNEHTWATQNPRVVKVTRTQFRFKVNVWAGIVDHHLVGPFIIDGNLSSEMYMRFLRDELPILMENIPLSVRRRIIFQQDGAPPHTTNAVKDYLNDTFTQPWIGRNGPIVWPSRSPDLTPMDFYLWGHYKQEVYSTPSTTREELIDKIYLAAHKMQQALNNMNLDNEVRRRLDACIEVNGRHFEQYLK